MSASEMTLYQKIGELFYALAATNSTIHDDDYKKLLHLVHEDWKQLDEPKGAFGSNASHQILNVLNWFDYEHMQARDCFENFVDYYTTYQKRFSEQKKKIIYKTAEKINTSFKNSNTIAPQMITELKSVFEGSKL